MLHAHDEEIDSVTKVLIVDDDEGVRFTLSAFTEKLGCDPICASCLSQAIDALSSIPFDVILLDVNLPDGDGLSALAEFKEVPSAPEIIIITGYGNPDGAELAIRTGAWDYIGKGSTLEEVRLPLMRALKYRKEKRRCRTPVALNREGIIGNSKELEACLELVAKAATSHVNVMITGETGTGKERFARAVHANSPRKDQNFVVVDCAALPENLVESILFGHEKGAYTGADRARVGLIELADGGTLFLDEVGELPMQVQKPFLRVLQEHRFRTIGGKREMKSDFRLVAATHQDLDSMARSGQFREDLLYRLRALSIDLPPLRNRSEDIKDLTLYYVNRLCDKENIEKKQLSPDFLDALAAYHWPGNVRQLIHTIERVLAITRLEPTLFAKDLPVEIRVRLAQKALCRHDADHDNRVSEKNFESLQTFRETAIAKAESEYLSRLLPLTGWNIAETCRISEISRSRLYCLLQKHNINRPD